MRKPAESQVNTIFVPPPGGSPATLYIAAEVPLRLVVRNAGGVNLLLAHDTNSLSQGSLAGTFQLGVGQSEVFVLMPRQGMYAIAAGAGTIVSLAVSEALPETWMES